MRKEQTLNSVLSEKENIDLILSYSRISDFDRNGPKALIEKSIVDNQGLKMGSLIDDMLFDNKNLRSKYHISDFNEPTATLGVLSKIILNNYLEVPNKEEILEIIKLNNFWSTTKKEETLIKNFDTDEFWGYLNDKFKSIDKIVVTSDEQNKAESIVNVLQTHKFSKSIFTEELEHFYQFKFKIKINKFYFRGILDIISIDHTTKKIYFKDLKTGGASNSEFMTSFIKYRYYLQAAIYSLAFEEICKILDLKDYTLAPFEFIYIGLKEQIPVSYTFTDKWNYHALNGFKTSSGYKYKGLYELIDEIYFHWSNNMFDLPMNIYTSNGKILLEDNFITSI